MNITARLSDSRALDLATQHPASWPEEEEEADPQ